MTSPSTPPQAELQTQTHKSETSFKWLILLLTAVAACLLIMYFINFNGGWGNQGDFGAFGDFLGGVLNPILGFATVGLLIWSLKLQMNELALSRKELALTRQELAETKEETALSRKAMEAQVEHLKVDSSLKELRELLSMQMNFIDANLRYQVGKIITFEGFIEITLEKILDSHEDILGQRDSLIARINSKNASIMSIKFNLLEQQVVQYAMLTKEYFEITNKKAYTFPYLTNALTMAQKIQNIKPSKHIDTVLEGIRDSIRTS